MQDKIYITNVTDSLEKKSWYVIVKTLSGKADFGPYASTSEFYYD